MIGSECDWDQEEICLPLFDVVLDSGGCLCAEPGGGADLGLPDETVGVGMPQFGHDGVDGGGDFGGVRVSAVDDGHWEGVRGEEEDDTGADVFWVGSEGSADVVCDCGDEAGVGRPAVNDAPFDGVLRVEFFRPFPEFVEGGTCGGAAVLRILGECDSALDARGLELAEGVFCEGIGVAEGDKGFVGGGGGVELVEEGASFPGLEFAPFADGGAPADDSVLVLDLGGAPPGDEGTKVVLEAAEGDEVGISLR